MLPNTNPIFRDIGQEEVEEMRACGGVRLSDYRKDEVIFHVGDVTSEFGVLLSGKIHIENIDLWGNRMILHNIAVGQAFAETYAFCGVPLMVDVTAVEESKVLFLNIGLLLAEKHRDRTWHPKLLYNLLLLSVHKNLAWSSRMFCITPKQVRARVMTYLSSEAIRRGSRTVTIPFDRQQMADYLNVERSALSKELGRMKKEGILDYHKNTFQLLRGEGQEEVV